MKLFYSKGSCSLAVRIVLHETGAVFSDEAVDLKKKLTASGENYLEINPKGSVPALLTYRDGLLTENAVIQQYLADEAQADHLFPPLGDFKRYRVLEWLNYISTDLHKSFSPLFNPSIPDELKKTIFTPLIEAKFNFINEKLSYHHFLIGEHFTLPDAYLFVVTRWAKGLGFDMQKWPHVLRHFADVQNRPAVQKALQDEGLSVE